MTAPVEGTSRPSRAEKPRRPEPRRPGLFSHMSSWRARLLMALGVIGPGIITANADNDAGGISTYSVAGASYGYSLLWMLVLITFSLGVTQEMGARMGAATGKGLAALIRENFGVRWTLFAMVCTLAANTATTVAEFAGVAAAGELFGIPRWLSVPISALAVWLLVVRWSFRSCLLYTSDAADDLLCVDLGGRRIIK